MHMAGPDRGAGGRPAQAARSDEGKFPIRLAPWLRHRPPVRPRARFDRSSIAGGRAAVCALGLDRGAQRSVDWMDGSIGRWGEGGRAGAAAARAIDKGDWGWMTGATTASPFGPSSPPNVHLASPAERSPAAPDNRARELESRRAPSLESSQKIKIRAWAVRSAPANKSRRQQGHESTPKCVNSQSQHAPTPGRARRHDSSAPRLGRRPMCGATAHSRIQSVGWRLSRKICPVHRSLERPAAAGFARIVLLCSSFVARNK